MKSNIQIGEYILNYRKQHRLTQGEFGELLGVSTQAVSKWERKICYPDIFLLPAILPKHHALGLDTAAFPL